ncbi:MAG: hypothetical protein N3E37_04640 [Candidatus Micrarchaeota archaeon]|nr:hypothetical protein [Candidatus Micrarchaeota archaeon]
MAYELRGKNTFFVLKRFLLELFNYIRLILEIKANKNEYVFFLSWHMGDLYLFCSHVGVIKRKYSKKICIVLPSKYLVVANYFLDVTIDRIIVDDRVEIQSSISWWFYRIINHIFVIVFGHLALVVPQIRKSVASYSSLILFNIFYDIKRRSPLESFLFPLPNFCSAFQDLDLPALPKINKLIYRERIKEKLSSITKNNKKTVMLYPYSKTSPTLPKFFWENLCASLKAKGYVVLCNQFEDEEVIDGAIPIHVPLEEAIVFAEEIGWVIGLRSGIFDLISTSYCKKTIIETRMLKEEKLEYGFNLKSIVFRIFRNGVKIPLTKQDYLILPIRIFVDDYSLFNVITGICDHYIIKTKNVLENNEKFGNLIKMIVERGESFELDRESESTSKYFKTFVE